MRTNIIEKVKERFYSPVMILEPRYFSNKVNVETVVCDKNDRIGTYLFGSQNYNLDGETSDIDTWSFIVPSIDAIAHGCLVEKTVSYENGNDTIFDIRSLPNLVARADPQFLEILFTNYFYIGLNDNCLFEIYKDREFIAHSNEMKWFYAMRGRSYEYLRKVLKLNDKEKVAKAYANLCFNAYMIGNYHKYPYEELLSMKNDRAKREAIFLAKYDTNFDLKDGCLRRSAQDIMDMIENQESNFINSEPIDLTDIVIKVHNMNKSLISKKILENLGD